MMASTDKSLARRTAGLIGLVLAVAACFFLAPQSVGGSVAYTVITGQSMEPWLSAGDLVVVRERASYGIGDAIAYRSAHLGQVVLHRVISEEDGRFRTKGDNNDFVDSDRPTSGDVLGAQWVHLPRVGAAFTFLRSPVGLALGAAAIMGVLGVFSVGERRRRRHARRRAGVDGETKLPQPSSVAPVDTPSVRTQRIPLAAAIVAAATVATSALTVAAFSRPLFRSEPTRVTVVHEGEFSYSAPAPRGPVYQEPRVSAGDPVFVRLVRELEVGFDYDFSSDGAEDIEVSGDIDAVLRTDNGWTHSIEVAPNASATQDHIALRGRLDLTEVRSTLRRVEKLTGMAPGTYSLTLEPHVIVEAMVENERIIESFAPALPFQLNDIQLGMVRSSQGDEAQALEQLLKPVQKSAVAVDRMVSNPFELAGRRVPVLALRRVGLVLSILLLLVCVCLGLAAARRRPKDEATRIQARYSSLLIPVVGAPEMSHETVDVADFDTLVRLAQQFEQPVMHQQQAGGDHSYSLYYDGLLYRYRITAGTVEAPLLQFEPPSDPDRPMVRAVLTRPPRPSTATEEDVQASR